MIEEVLRQFKSPIEKLSDAVSYIYSEEISSAEDMEGLITYCSELLSSNTSPSRTFSPNGIAEISTRIRKSKHYINLLSKEDFYI